MSQYLEIHPESPQQRLLQRAVDALRVGGVIVYPTDSCYALGCMLDNKQAIERIYRIRSLDKGHHMSLICPDLSSIATYARVDNRDYRLMKSLTPGPYTFILKASSEVPRRLMHPKRKTIGIRVPDHAILHGLLEVLGEPLMSTTLLMPGDDYPMFDPYDINQLLQSEVDVVIDGGSCGLEETSVISLEEDVKVLREGKGDTSKLR